MDNMLKKLWVAVLASIALVGCGTAGQISDDSQDKAVVSQILDSRSYTVDIDWMSPLRGPGKAVTGGYSVSVNEDMLDSYLPYIGDARSIPYGGGKGLVFKEKVQKYEDSGWKKGKRIIGITVTNDEDTYEYTLTFFENGNADVSVLCRNRDSISYRGALKLERQE